MRPLGINIYKNNGAPGLPPAPGAGNWLQSFSFTQGDVPHPGVALGSRSHHPVPGIPGCTRARRAYVPPVIWGGGSGGAESPRRIPSAGVPLPLSAGPSSRAPFAFSQLGQESEASICPLAPGLRRIPAGCCRLDISPGSILCAVSALKFKLLFSIPRWPELTDKHLLEREKDGVFIIPLYYRCCHFNPSWMPGERLRPGTGLEPASQMWCLQSSPRPIPPARRKAPLAAACRQQPAASPSAGSWRLWRAGHG